MQILRTLTQLRLLLITILTLFIIRVPHTAQPIHKQTLYQQTSLIGFKSQALELFAQSEPSFLEIAESIDLNRMISAGVNIR